LLRQIGPNFFRLLVGDQFFLHQQVEQRSGILRLCQRAANHQAHGCGD